MCFWTHYTGHFLKIVVNRKKNCRYNESGKEDELENCRQQMSRLERKAKKYDDERERLAEDINAINKDVATQKVFFDHYQGYCFFFTFDQQYVTQVIFFTGAPKRIGGQPETEKETEGN